MTTSRDYLNSIIHTANEILNDPSVPDDDIRLMNVTDELASIDNSLDLIRDYVLGLRN